MNGSWYCQVNGQPFGPYAFANLQQYVAEGRLNAASLVRSGTTGPWLPAASVPGLIAGMAPPAVPPPVGAESSAEETTPRTKPGAWKVWLAIGAAAIGVGLLGGYVLIALKNQPSPVAARRGAEGKAQIQVSQNRIQNALNSVSRWSDSLAKLQTKSFRLQLAGVWSPPFNAGDESAERYLYVEVRVENLASSGKPLVYSSWNREKTASGLPTVVMIDDEGVLCPLVSAGDDAADGESVDLQLEPGEEVSDVMIFAYPKGDFEFVRLALCYEAIDNGTKYFGFRIPHEAIGQNPPSRDSMARRGVAQQGDEEGQPSLEEINRQLERQIQREKERKMEQ